MGKSMLKFTENLDQPQANSFASGATALFGKTESERTCDVGNTPLLHRETLNGVLSCYGMYRRAKLNPDFGL